MLVPTMPQGDSAYATNAAAIPAQDGRPYQINEWQHLWRHELVELRRGARLAGTGRVDEITADGTTMWIHLTEGAGRIMLHRTDGIDVWRVDARICQNRPQT
nr:hypothetical protein GCM10017547_13700 [Pseudarthrobacter oxydans]